MVASEASAHFYDPEGITGAAVAKRKNVKVWRDPDEWTVFAMSCYQGPS